MKTFLTAVFCALLPLLSIGQVSVLTQHNDNARTGMNLNETELSPATVDSAGFGKLFSRRVDEQMYAQPLIVSHLLMPGFGYRNVVFCATVKNSVYAFDADNPYDTVPFWHINVTPSGAKVPLHTDMTGACGGSYTDFTGHIGIVGTPVIDTGTNIMYFLSRDIVTKTSVWEQWLHSVDITTGKEKAVSPVKITAKYKGNGAGSLSGYITFDPQKQNQRAALALVKGIVYLSWASHCDWGPYHGWVMGYSADSLKRRCLWMDNPNGSNCGIWMSGQGISSDTAGNLYLSTGNGDVGYNGNPANTINRGESVLKLQLNGSSLKVASFFTPHEWGLLEAQDLDIGSMGVLLIPGTNWAVAGGKEGKMYLLNRDTMGGVHAKDRIYESYFVGYYNEFHGGVVFWHNDSNDHIYVWPTNQQLFGFKLDYKRKLFDTATAMLGKYFSPSAPPGAMLSLTANGSKYNSGIIWAALPYSGNANQGTTSGILRAFDARNLKELWNSKMKTKDNFQYFAKFVCPTVANGKVYMATFSNQLVVYGVSTPKDSFIIAKDSFCQGEPVAFTNYSDTVNFKIKAYHWDFGDGSTSAMKNPVHIFSSAGYFWVSLYDSVVGAHNIYRHLVYVSFLPKPGFRLNDSIQCLTANNFIFVHDTTALDSMVRSKKWNFGDGSYASADSVSHSYKTAGNYTVTLTFTGILNCKDSVSKIVHVGAPFSGLDFSINDSAQCLKSNAFQFTNTTPAGPPGLGSQWSFGNGAADTARNPVYSFRDTGVYKVSMRLSSATGCSDSVHKIVKVYPSPGRVYFKVNDSGQCISGNSFSFTDSSTSVDTGFAKKWTFGDGGTASGKSVRHTYALPGKYKVTVTESTKYNCSDSTVGFVNVYALPAATISGDTGSFVGDTSLYILKTDPSNTIISWKYTGNNFRASGRDSLWLAWTMAGKQNIIAYIKNRYGCTDSILWQVYVSNLGGITEAGLPINSLGVSPNPNKGLFTYSFETTERIDLWVSITDALGREVYARALPGRQGLYSGSARLISKGTYYLQIHDKQGRRAITKVEVQ